MKKALFPGSFDPFTIGHQNLVKRALPFFAEVWIGIALSAEKSALSSVKERAAWIQKCFPSDSRIQVVHYAGLTVDFMKENGITTMIRGLRSATDFEFESQLSGINHKLYPELETLFLLSAAEFTHVHSKYVRELISYKKSLKGFVPDEILLILETKFGIQEQIR